MDKLTNSLPQFRGLYVDRASDIVGNQLSELSLLLWCQDNNINELSLYDSATMVGNKSWAALLNLFIGSAKTYGMNVALIASNSTIAANEYKFFQLYKNEFPTITTEYEFWNEGKSYGEFKELLRAISNMSRLKRHVYFSQFRDGAGVVTDEATIAQRVVGGSDRIFLVNYNERAYNLSGSTLGKLKKLALAAKQLGKVVDIVILFNVNKDSSDPNVYDYYSVTGEGMFDVFKMQYNAATIPNKSHLNLIGYQLYKYSQAIKARP
jgi:hypothetical protein